MSAPGEGVRLDELPLFQRGPRGAWVVAVPSLVVAFGLIGGGVALGGAGLALVVIGLPVLALGVYAGGVANAHVIVSHDRLTVRNVLHQVDVSVTGVRSIRWVPRPWAGPLARPAAAVGLRRELGLATLTDGREVPLLATSARPRVGTASPAAGRLAFDRIVAAWQFTLRLRR